MKKRAAIIALFISALAVLVVGYRANRRYLAHYPRVQAAMASRGDLVEDVEVSGKILGEDVQNLYANIDGKIVKVYVKEGDYVRAGQPIFSFDADEMKLRLAQCRADILRLEQEGERLREQGITPEIIAAEGRVRQERLSLEQAQRDLRKKESLYADGVIAKIELEKSQDDYEAAKQRYEQAQKELQLSRANKISRSLELNEANLKVLRLQEEVLKKEIQDLTFTSPINGRVSQILLKEGERVQREFKIGQIIDESNLTVEAEVPAEDAPKVKIGDSAEISFGTIADPYRAKVIKLLPPIKNTDGTYGGVRVRLRVTSKDAVLIPGTSVRVRIRTGRAKMAVIVPIEAIHEERKTIRGDREYFSVRPATGKEREYVFTLTDCSETLGPAEERERRWLIRDNIYQVRKVYVKTGISNADRIEVLSGLAPFTQVVVYSDRDLEDYDRVIVVSRDERYKRPM